MYTHDVCAAKGQAGGLKDNASLAGFDSFDVQTEVGGLIWPARLRVDVDCSANGVKPVWRLNGMKISAKKAIGVLTDHYRIVRTAV